MNIYLIRNIKTKKYLSVSVYSNNDREDCNDVGATFETECYETPYCVSSEKVAQLALSVDPKWYNSCLERPEWPKDFNRSDYEIQEVEMP